MTAQYVGTLSRPNASYTITGSREQPVVVTGSALAEAMRIAPVNFVPGHFPTAKNSGITLGNNVGGAINTYADAVSYKGRQVSKSSQGAIFGHEVLHSLGGYSANPGHNAEFSAALTKLSGNGGGPFPGTNRALDLGPLPTVSQSYFSAPYIIGGSPLFGSGGGGGN
jgi:hypothetical protein